MAKIEIYIKEWCPYCTGARRLLRAKGVDFEEIEIGCDAALAAEMRSRSGRCTVPQIFIDGCAIGGFDDLQRLDRGGHLDRLLASEG